MSARAEASPPKALAVRRKWTAYLPLLVPAFGIVELFAHFYFSARAPSSAQWSALRPVVESWRKPGSAVVVAPSWAEPMARMSFGDSLMPLRDVARPDLTRYPEALEISIVGARSPETSGWKVLREEKLGRYVLREMGNPFPPAVTYDFTDHVDPASASVRIEGGPTARPCPFSAALALEGGGLGGPPIYPASRFQCPGEPSNVFVGVTVIDDEQEHPRRCIWSHPPAPPGELTTIFRNVPLGSQIHGHTGLGWLVERDRAGPPFVLRIVVDGATVGHVEHAEGEGWKPFVVPLGNLAQRRGTVEFRVSGPAGAKDACFEADSR